ncbi:hypothetical protein JYT32_00690 [Dehalococcoides mccartyi]|nr:hypothetical protein [Dehalococcoides mccartyi]
MTPYFDDSAPALFAGTNGSGVLVAVGVSDVAGSDVAGGRGTVEVGVEVGSEIEVAAGVAVGTAVAVGGTSDGDGIGTGVTVGCAVGGGTRVVVGDGWSAGDSVVAVALAVGDTAGLDSGVTGISVGVCSMVGEAELVGTDVLSLAVAAGLSTCAEVGSGIFDVGASVAWEAVWVAEEPAWQANDNNADANRRTTIVRDTPAFARNFMTFLTLSVKMIKVNHRGKVGDSNP